MSAGGEAAASGIVAHERRFASSLSGARRRRGNRRRGPTPARVETISTEAIRRLHHQFPGDGNKSVQASRLPGDLAEGGPRT